MSYAPKILIVDDEPRMCDSLEALLSGRGYEINTSNSGKEAIEQLSRGNFDLIILDIVMPEMNGFKVMEHIKDRDLNTLVIVMTGNASIESAIEALRKGAYDYLRKPFEHEELLKPIKNALDQKSLESDLNLAKNNLKESEEKYQRLFNTVSDAIMVFDGVSRQFVDVNDAAKNLYGYTREEFLYINHADITAEEEESVESIEQTLNGKLTRIPLRYHKKKDGTLFPVEISSSTFSLAGHKMLCFVVRDITERKQVEEALRENELKYKTLVHNIPGMVYRGYPDWSAEIISSSEEICGYTTDELNSKEDGWLSIINPDDTERVYREGSELTKRPKEIIQTYRILTKGGNIRWVEDRKLSLFSEEGEFIGIDGIVIDITSRKQAEEALRESVERYRTLIAKMSNGFALHEILCDKAGKPCDYRFQEVNSAFEEMTGLKAEKIVGKTVLEILPHTESYWIDTYGKVALTGESVHFENYSQEFNRYFEVLAYSPKKGQFATVFTDITDRRKAEETLQFTQFAIDNSSDAAFWMGPDARFIYVNDAACRALGYSREELLTKTVHDISPEFPAEVWPEHWADLQLRGSFTFETLHRRKDGIDFPVEIAVNFIKFGDREYNCAFARDISERRRAEKELRESRRFLDTVFDSIQDGISVLDAELNIVRVNQTMRKRHAHKLPLEGKKCYEAYRGRSEACEICPALRALSTGTIERNEIQLTQVDSVKGTLELFAFPMLDDSGRTKWVIECIRDITERKELETKLQQAQKMESIGTLAGGIAHEFNNILGIIVGNAELAMIDVPEWNPAKANLVEVKAACLRGRDVVKQLLTYTRKTDEKRKPLNITPIITDSLKLIRASIPTTVEIRQNLQVELGTILADSTQLHQIMINLCSNSAYAMAESGGILEVTLTNVELDEKTVTQYPGLEPGTHIRLSVSDTGCGISPEHIDRIFDPFFTTKDVGKGTGMGLAIVHGIAKSHEGEVSVISKSGKGTTFNILFPVVEREVIPESEITEELPTGNERILFIDDEISIVKMGRQILERLGYKPEIRTNPVEALELFRSNPDRFDLVITDMTMPQMTGDKLAEEVMTICPDMPVILCTGFSEIIDEEKAREIGIKAFVMKPIVMSEIANSIREVLNKK